MVDSNDSQFATEDALRHIMLDYRQMTEFVKEPFLVAKADGIRFWDVYGKEYLDGLAGIFTVNVESIVLPQGKPLEAEIIRHPGSVVLVPVTETSEIVETGEVMVFLGDCFVVTVRHGEHGALKRVRARLQDDPDMLSRGPSAVLYAIADHVVDTYLDVADHIEADIDQIEEHAFSARRGRDPGLVYQVKRELLELRRAVNPLAQPLRVLAGTDLPEVDAKVREYFRDVEDHLTRVHETVAGYDELLASLLQANLAQLSITQNEDVRKITAWAAIIAVPTAIAGVYGMNFDYMPELTWRFGYPLVLAVIALTCVLLYRGFKRNGWL